MEDPFFVVKGEVLKALSNVDDLYQRWLDLSTKSNVMRNDESEWLMNEIKTTTRSIEWDLEDLLETISIVEGNPEKFHLTQNDIVERHEFIKSTKEKLKDITNKVLNPKIKNKNEKHKRNNLMNTKHYNGNKYSRLENEMEDSNQRFITDQQQQQQILMSHQDDQLENVSKSVGVLKSMGSQIGNELEGQAIIMDDLGHEIEQTDSRLQTVLVRVEKMLRLADDKKQTYVLLALVLLLVIVVILFISL